MSSSSNGTSSTYKSKVEGEVVSSRPLVAHATYQSKNCTKGQVKDTMKPFSLGTSFHLAMENKIIPMLLWVYHILEINLSSNLVQGNLLGFSKPGHSHSWLQIAWGNPDAYGHLNSY